MERVIKFIEMNDSIISEDIVSEYFTITDLVFPVATVHNYNNGIVIVGENGNTIVVNDECDINEIDDGFSFAYDDVEIIITKVS